MTESGQVVSSDEEFYQKLMALREEQKATLKQLESLYASKIELQDSGEVEVTGSAENLEDLAARNMQLSNSRLAQYEREYQDLSLEDFRNETVEPENHNEAQERVDVTAEGMWDGVSITDYMRQLDLEHERNLENIDRALTKHKVESDSRAKKTVDNWKPHVTVPKPFSMTIREYEQPKKKSRSQQIFELEQEQRRLSEMKELSRRFRANPVPGNTYLPLYQAMQERDKEIRDSTREMRKSELKSMEKPFKFSEREKDYARISKLSKSIDTMIAEENDRPVQFKAKPVPKKLLEKPGVQEKLQEEEMYRQIRCKLRSQALLKQSKAPVSSPDTYKSHSNRDKQQTNDTQKTIPRRSKSALSHSVPDFDAQYKKFLDDVSKTRTIKESTVCKPFTMRTEQKHLSKVDKCVKADLDTRTRTTSTGINFRPPVSGAPARKPRVYKSDTIPPKITRSFELMATKTRERLNDSARDSKMSESEEKKRRAKEQALRKHIISKAAANDHRLLLEEARARKLQEFREQQRELEMEYQQKLADMSNRLENRQLLFERQSEINAKKEAEKRYIETLKKAGIDDDLLTSINSAAASAYDLKLEDLNDSFVEESLDDSYGSDFDSSEKLAAEH